MLNLERPNTCIAEQLSRMATLREAF